MAWTVQVKADAPSEASHEANEEELINRKKRSQEPGTESRDSQLLGFLKLLNATCQKLAVVSCYYCTIIW